jgi:hypothetical protein
MNHASNVFCISTSIEDDRPQVDFEREEHRAIDWLRVGHVLRTKRPISDYPEVSLSVEQPDATEWDFFSVAGTLGLLSDRAIECIGRPAFRLFDLLPASINGEDYRFLRCKETLQCFDRENSVVIPFPSDPDGIMDVTQYRFKMELIPDPICFSIPEFYELFATQSVKLAAENAHVKGIDFELLA